MFDYAVWEDTVKLPLSLLLAVLLIVPACSQNETQSTQAASEQKTNPSDQMNKQRDDYVKSMEARLTEFDKKVDALDKRADALTGAAKSNSKSLIDQLRDQRKNAASKLDDLKGAKNESWTTMKGEVDSAMAGLDHAYDRASASIPTTSPTR
jgi:TolA-binding protein